MPSLETTLRGQFRALYRQLERSRRLVSTPILFCEGDSWFGTPLAMNLLDWLVFPSAEAEAHGVPLFGGGGLFFRAEHSGDRAVDMFTPRKLADLERWLSGFAFDIVLLSAGGNDLVGRFLERRFADCGPMSVDAAIAHLLDSGQFERVHDAYADALAAFEAARPGIPVLAHSYDYPQRIGVAAELTLANVGLVALLGKRVGDWIGGHLARCLPAEADQLEFAKRMIDAWVARVLEPLKQRFANFDYVDLRGMLPAPELWFDELHPTSEDFRRLSERFRAAVAVKLPPAKLQPLPA